ncbi:MAG: hypothetical protein WBN07_13880 [Woeseiaceae bacterium]
MPDDRETGAKLKRAETTDEILDVALSRGRRTRSAEDKSEAPDERASAKKFADIESNPFYKIAFAEGDPEEKKSAIAKALAYDITDEKSDNKARLAAFDLFKEWLMDQRKDMAQEIINLTDTDAFSELKDVFDEMNQGLLNFEEQMSPLTDILDAVYRLRMASDGAMFDVFREIKEDKEEEARIEARRQELDQQIQSLNGNVSSINAEIEQLYGQKSWFGLGGTKKDALRKIAAKEAALSEVRQNIDTVASELKQTKFNRESRFKEFAEEKAKLRELLDISSEEHKQRQQALVDAANNFVKTADTRTSNVLVHLEGINAQVDRLADSNGGMRNVYAVISEAVEEAENVNTDVRDSLAQEPSDESNIAKMKRENQKMAVEEHVTALTAAKVDTLGTFSDLTAESYRIKSMKDANNSQVAKTRSLNSKGVAGVASRLSTVLQGVSMAALSESSEVAQMTLERMNSQTNRITQKEALKNAMGINTENDALVKAIEELESYGKIARAATDISREGYEEMKENLAALEKTARDVGDAVKEAVAVGADVMSGADAEPDDEVKEKPKGDSNPFSRLN